MDTNNPNNAINPAPQNPSAGTAQTGTQSVPDAPVSTAVEPANTPASTTPPPAQPSPQSIVSSNTVPPVQPPVSPAGVPPVSPPTVTPLKKKSRLPLLMLVFLLVIIFVGGLSVAALYFQSQLRKNTVPKQTVQTQKMTIKSLIIGSDTTYPPMESIDTSGKYVGYDIDLGNLVAKELGATVQFKSVKFDDIFTGLDKKQYDMIISSVTINEERKKKYDFSDPYINAGEVVITKKMSSQSAAQLLTAKDLAGKKIGVEQGTVEVANAEKLTSSDLVMQYPSNEPALTDLADGKIDAVLTDLPNAKGIVSANPLLTIASDPLTDEYYGIVFRKGDPLVRQINQVLSQLTVKGVLTDLKQKWLD